MLLLILLYFIIFAGSGGGGSNGKVGSGGGDGKNSDGGGGKVGNGCDFQNTKLLRVNLGQFQYLPNTILTTPQWTCGQNGPDFSATPHRFEVSAF